MKKVSFHQAIVLMSILLTGCKTNVMHQDFKSDMSEQTVAHYKQKYASTNFVDVALDASWFPFSMSGANVKIIENDFLAQRASSQFNFVWRSNEEAAYSSRGKLIYYNENQEGLFGLIYASKENVLREGDTLINENQKDAMLLFYLSQSRQPYRKNTEEDFESSMELWGWGLLYLNHVSDIRDPEKYRKHITSADVKDIQFSGKLSGPQETTMLGLGSLYYGYQDSTEESHHFLLGMFGYGTEKNEGDYVTFLWFPISFS